MARVAAWVLFASSHKSSFFPPGLFTCLCGKREVFNVCFFRKHQSSDDGIARLRRWSKSLPSILTLSDYHQNACGLLNRFLYTFKLYTFLSLKFHFDLRQCSFLFVGSLSYRLFSSCLHAGCAFQWWIAQKLRRFGHVFSGRQYHRSASRLGSGHGYSRNWVQRAQLRSSIVFFCCLGLRRFSFHLIPNCIYLPFCLSFFSWLLLW